MSDTPENILQMERPAGEPAAAVSQGQPKGYKLDWNETAVKLAKGRFTHTLRRPTVEEVLERDREITTELPIGKDGSFSLPDPTMTEEIDAEYHDKLAVSVEGYPGAVPARHKAAAFQGLYQRAFDVAEGSDLFAPEITVVEEIGGGDEPDFTIEHTLTQPSEDQIKKFRQRSEGGELKPGKRGKRILRPYSNLRLAIQFYDDLVTDIRGAHVGGRTYSPETRAAFIATVDPLVKRAVVGTLISKISESLLD